jgi:crotonobetainyl-CoA:carnitine CoA-transferase CaiB-like acyl-CoA transferase
MQAMAERLFRTIGRPDLGTDPRFATNTDRVRNNDELDPIIADFMRSRTREETLDLFDEAGVTVGPVCDAADLMIHPYVRERECLVSFPDPEMGELPMHNVTPRLSGTPGSVRTPAPLLGEHNEEILGALGISAAEQEKLERDGVI